MPLIFVYGTLKRGFSNAAELDGSQYERDVCTAGGYELHIVHGYPALSHSDTGVVHGELYTVSAEHLQRLDVFEGVPDWYRRESIELEDGTRAEAYVLPMHTVVGKPKIDGGRFSE